MTTIDEPLANVTDGDVQLYILSHMPDTFQGVAEMVLNRLPKSPRVDLVTDISKENCIKFFERKQRGTSKIHELFFLSQTRRLKHQRTGHVP